MTDTEQAYYGAVKLAAETRDNAIAVARKKYVTALGDARRSGLAIPPEAYMAYSDAIEVAREECRQVRMKCLSAVRSILQNPDWLPKHSEFVP